MTSQTIQPSYPHLRWNLRNLYWDVFWFGILAGSSMAFLAVYATRLGASSLQIGLLSAGTAVINLLFTLPVGRWLEGRPLVRASFRSSVWHRLGYVVLVALPWVLNERSQVWGIVWITLIMSIPGTLLAISFNSMFAEVVPGEWRARAVGWRNALVGVTVTVSTLVSGWILDKVTFPVNYQIVFVLGGVGAMMSSYHLGRIRPPVELSVESPAPAQKTCPGVLAWLKAFPRLTWQGLISRRSEKSLLRLDVLRGPFGLFLLAYLSFYTFQYFGLPIFPIFYVRELGLSDGIISIGSALFHATMVLVSLVFNRLSARFGYRRLLIVGALTFGQYSLLLGLAQDEWLYYVACVIGGVIFGFLNGAMLNRLMERTPVDDRPAHMALHNLALNLGILAGSLIGPTLADWIGLRPALYLTAGLRFLSGILMILFA
ncbi:MAG: MFS transporter [Anaerolineales bacterium]|nr:MFS transporter [Anaerolineales bacterium]